MIRPLTAATVTSDRREYGDGEEPTMSDDDGQTGEEDSQVIRELRNQVKALKGDATEAEGLRQKVAVLEAGLTLTPKQQTALLAAHDGDLEAGALKATAMELGFAAAPVEPEQPAADPQRVAEAQTLENIEQAGSVPQAVEGTPSFEEALAAARGDKDATMEVIERYGALASEEELQPSQEFTTS